MHTSVGSIVDLNEHAWQKTREKASSITDYFGIRLNLEISHRAQRWKHAILILIIYQYSLR
jgi:hypothetical protein